MLKAVVTSLLLLAAPLSAQVAQDFYEQQLRAGKADLAANHTVLAGDELRIAAFGLLDRPPLLIESLVRLAIAQNTLGQTGALTQTLTRFLDVERRFPSYASAALEPQTRREFDALLVKAEPRSEIAAIPSLAPLVRSEAAKVADLPPSQRQAAYEAGFRRAPADIEWPLAAAKDASARGVDAETIEWSRRALAIDRSSAQARALLVHALAHRGDCRDALKELNQIPATALAAHPDLPGDELVCVVALSRWNETDAVAAKLPDAQKARPDVARALQEIAARRNPAKTVSPASSNTAAAAASMMNSAQALASAKSLVKAGRYPDAENVLGRALATDPGNRELRLELLEASSLAHDWRTAVSQVPTVLPFKEGEEAAMFYASAALYENGRKAEAKEYMERARPRLNSTPLVNYYARLILGESPK